MAIYDVSTTEKKAAPSLVAGGTLYADSPIGTILPYGGASAPSGWFLCDGTAVSRTTFSELFAVIGTAFGAGDGSTTFNLPDMRESVPKGAGLTGKSSNHYDSDGVALGEFIDDRTQSEFGIVVSGSGSYNVNNSTAGGTYYRASTNRHGATTEVKSVGVNYIIKAKMIGVPSDFLAKVDEAVSEVYGDIIPSDASASNKLITKKYMQNTIFNGSTPTVIHSVSNNIIEILGMSSNNTELLDTIIVVGFSGQTFHYDKGNVNPTITPVYDSTTNTYDVTITATGLYIVSITSCRGVTIS